MCDLFKNFNHSVWHAFWVVLPIGLVVYLWAFLTHEKGPYLFDPRHNPNLKDAGDFEPHSKRYQDIAKLFITLSAGSIAFIVSVLASDKSSATTFVQKVASVAPIVVGYFACCIVLLITFMVALTVCYEKYCHSADHRTYKHWQYVLNMSLGWTGLISFVLGFFWLATNVLD